MKEGIWRRESIEYLINDFELKCEDIIINYVFSLHVMNDRSHGTLKHM